MAAGQNKTTLSSAQNDGRALLNFSDDDMDVLADFLPAGRGGKALSLDYVRALLERLKIVYGILWNNIERAINESNTSGRPSRGVLIAQGSVPIDEVEAYYKLEEDLQNPQIPHFQGMEKTNYRAFSPFIVVRKNQILASLQNSVEGVPGRTVHGVDIPFKSAKGEGVSPGKNTRHEGKTIVCDIEGQLVIAKGILNVESALALRGAVGYATGDINFPGDVSIEGQVNDGFKLNVGGSLNVRETLDVTDLIVKNDLNVRGGMIGRGRALVKVSGMLSTRFIQNCRVACKKTIEVRAEIINSTVYTMESVSLPSGGTIMGSEISAFHSLIVGKIRKEHGKPSKIQLGTNWTLKQEIDANENMMRLLTAKLQKIAALREAGDGAAGNMENLQSQNPKILEIKTRLSSEYEKCFQKKIELEKRYIIDEAAYLECQGELAEDTVVDICGVELIVKEPLKRVRIILDKEFHRITAMPL